MVTSRNELIGIPHRLVIGERGLKAGVVEYVKRRGNEASDLPLENIAEHIAELVKQEMN